MESAAIDRALHRVAGYAAARSKEEDHMANKKPRCRVMITHYYHLPGQFFDVPTVCQQRH